MNNKILLEEKLKIKINAELQKMKGFKHYFSIIEDFYNLIILGEFNDVEIQRMLSIDDFLKKLLILWGDDARVTSLQEQILRELCGDAKKEQLN